LFTYLFTYLLTVRTQPEVVQEWMFRKIFGPRKEKVTGECRILHNGEFNDL